MRSEHYWVETKTEGREERRGRDGIVERKKEGKRMRKGDGERKERNGNMSGLYYCKTSNP